MAKELQIALTPWAPLAGGTLTGKYLKGEKGRVSENSARRNKEKTLIVESLVDVAKTLEVTPAQLAIRWTMQKEQTSIPIVGANKVLQIEESLGSVKFSIPDEQMNILNEVSKIEMGFPHDFLAGEDVKNVVYGGTKQLIIK
jgi:aryl-alcohol dehydrogenase-like predicted oxidoreductase